jgi:hypothetical protein
MASAALSLLGAGPNGAGFSLAQITGAVSLLVSVVLAGISVRKSIGESRTERTERLVKTTGAGAARDSVAVGTTERAVLVLDKALETMQEQYDRDMAQRQREIDGMRVGFERERATLNDTIHTCREAYDRACAQRDGMLDRLVVRDETIRELNDRVADLAMRAGVRPPHRLVVDANSDSQVEVDTPAEELALNTCPHDPEEPPNAHRPGPSGLPPDH